MKLGLHLWHNCQSSELLRKFVNSFWNFQVTNLNQWWPVCNRAQWLRPEVLRINPNVESSGSPSGLEFVGTCLNQAQRPGGLPCLAAYTKNKTDTVLYYFFCGWYFYGCSGAIRSCYITWAVKMSKILVGGFTISWRKLVWKDFRSNAVYGACEISISNCCVSRLQPPQMFTKKKKKWTKEQLAVTNWPLVGYLIFVAFMISEIVKVMKSENPQKRAKN